MKAITIALFLMLMPQMRCLAAGHGDVYRDAMGEGFAPLKKPVPAITWVSLKSGKFSMVAGDGITVIKSSRTVHIRPFYIAKALVTVEQYAECVEKGNCTAPKTGDICNWGISGRETHPVNCVNWNQARQYARFRGARLPTESEWEYAARSRGKNWLYPWGNTRRSRRKDSHTRPVCSDPASNTKQGLCDMTGEVWQWVQDNYSTDYNDTPADGSAYEGEGPYRIYRGGIHGEDALRIVFRFNNYGPPTYTNQAQGIRLAK